MALSSDLLSQFIKATNDKNDSKSETIVYGTIVKQADSDYVKIDGSELLTPVISTTVVKDGDKVTVMIKNHSAIVTGNITNPSAQNGDLQDVSDQISEVEILIADKVSTDELEAEKARIDELIADNVIIRGELEASSAKIDDIVADNIVINEKFTAFEADIEYIKANSLTVDVADLKYATIESLEATNAKINNLEVTYGEFYEVVTDELSAINANIENLNTEYATIDFANIGKAAIEEFFSKSGMISDLVVGDGTVTGELIGVTISGDLIKGNTIIAEKLVIKGEDGLYYRLNTDGMTTEVEQTDENSLNGQIIQAQSITATKIKVSDLYAFGATIGGFVITEDSIHSHLKDYVNNNSRGIYLDNTGQISFGDATNYVKFYKDADGNYRLAISASSISFSSGTSGGIEDAITNTEEEFYLSTSPTVLSGGSWSKNQPTWQNGKYIWRRTLVTCIDGTKYYTPSQNGVCITGNTGEPGKDGADGIDGTPGKDGVSIQSIQEKYAVSSSNSTPPTSWSDEVPNMTPTNKYLWNYEIITYSDKRTETTSKRVIGVYGNTGPQGPAGADGTDGKPGATGSPGADGVGIKTITNYYLVSSQNTGITVNTSGWTTTPPTTTTTNKYLWNYEAITYTNGNVVKGTPRIIGTHGATGPQGPNGANGISISKTEVFYYLSTSSTTQTGGSWVTTPPAWVSGKYYWQKIKTTFSNGSSSESTPVCITGAKGQNGSTGAAGQSVTSVTAEYYLSTSKTTQTGGSWVTTMPTWSSGKYLWIRNKIVYANPAKTEYTTPYCDSSWEAVNEIEVGGRNLLRNTNFEKQLSNKDYDVRENAYTLSIDNNGYNGSKCLKAVGKVVGSSGKDIRMYMTVQNEINTEYVFSGYIKGDKVTELAVRFGYGSSEIPIVSVGTDWKYFSVVVKSGTQSYGELLPYLRTIATVYFSQIKLEKGNKATDWTPAPEDVDADINDAAKTATNFLTYDSTNGLLIGNKTSGSWVGYRTQITASAFNILNASGSLVASYGATKIELGKNSINSIIEMCGGKAKIQYVTDNNTNYIEVNSENIRLRGNTLSSLYTYYNSGSGYAARSGVNAGRGFVEVYTMSSGNADPVTGEGTFDQSTLSLEPLEASIDSDGSVNILSGMGIDISAMQDIYIGSMNGSVIISGYTVGTSNGDTNTKRIPVIGSDGVMEVGTYIDFHPGGSPFDYSSRLQASTNGELSCSGTFSALSFNISGVNFADYNNGYNIGYGRRSERLVLWSSYIELANAHDIRFMADTRVYAESYNGSNNLYLKPDNGYLSLYSYGNAVYYNGKYYDSNWSHGKFYPGNAGVALGGSAYGNRWYRLYAANACSTSSDRRLKENITYFNEMPIIFNENEDNIVEAFFKNLKPSSFTMIGDKYNRLKLGFIAQDVIEALNLVGLTVYDVDFVSHGRDDEGNIDEEAMYSLCYEEFIALNTHMIQKAFDTIKKQNEEISKLKEQLSRII